MCNRWPGVFREFDLACVGIGIDARSLRKRSSGGKDRNCDGEKVEPCDRNDTTVGIVIYRPGAAGDPHRTVTGAVVAKHSNAPG